jgi:hypothetical protein
MALEAALSVLGGDPSQEQAAPTSAPAQTPAPLAPSKFDSVFANAGKQYGVDPQDLKRLAITESSLNPNAINQHDSNGGSFGLMQINGQHLAGMGATPQSILDPQTNVNAGAQIWANALQQAGGDKVKAVQIYKGATTPQGQQAVSKAANFIAGPAVPKQASNEPLPFSNALTALSGPESQPSLADQIPGQARAPAQEAPVSTYDRLVKGPIQAGAALATGAVAQPLGALAGLWHGLTSGKYGTAQGAQDAAQHAQDVAESLTYQPRSQAGQEALGTVANAIDASKVAGMGPTEAITLSGAAAMPLGSKWIGAGTKAAAPAAEAPVAGQMASVGAAGAKPADIAMASVANSSPELQATVAKTVQGLKPGQMINQQVLDRAVAADAVGTKLLKGQLTQDPEILSNEINNRLRFPKIMAQLNKQNQDLIDHANTIREGAAPDVYETSKPAVGQIPIDAYKTLHASEQGVIDQKWNAIRAQAGDEPIFDAGKMLQDAQAALKAKKLTTFDPGGQVSELVDDARRGGLTADGYVNWRMNLGREAMAGGNNGKAASAIIEATNKSDLLPSAAQYRDSVNDALAAGRALHTKIENDPAYAAVVNGSAVPDTFIDKYVVRAPMQDVQTMHANLADTPAAQQSLAAGLVDHLKGVAKIKPTKEGDAGNFAQDSFNTALEKLRPKLGVVLPAEQQQQMDNLGYVAKLVKGQPAGSAVNNSNTAVVQMGEAAKKGIEGAVNYAAHGLPVGTYGRKILSNISDWRATKDTLNPSPKVFLRNLMK